MLNALLLADRYNSDQDKILASIKPAIDFTSDALRANIESMLLRGNRFGIKTYILKSLQAQLATAMLATHFAGMRRALLTFQQRPKYLKLSHDDERIELELSVFSNVLDFLKKRLTFDTNKLQKEYDTLAFKVLSSASDKINEELTETVNDLIAHGAHIKEAKHILGAKFNQLGLRPASSSQLETIFRTQMQISFGAAKYMAERETGYIEGQLWGYKYVTTGDDRVRQSHAMLEGVTLPKDHVFWTMFYPPNGWNCRCQAIPLFEPYPIVEPETMDGIPIRPDRGFNWNAGAVFNPILAS